MGFLEGIGSWIADNESLLSGLAAIVAVAGVVLSPVLFATSRLRRRREEEAAAAHAAASSPRRLTYDDLLQPSPYPIQFAESDGLRIAYKQFGEGSPPILFAPGIVSHLHIASNLPPLRDSMEALGSMGRVTAFDKRGQGLSDPWTGAPTLDERCTDIAAVMDAAGIDSAVLVGVSEGGPMAVRYARDHPDRVRGLVLIGATARWLRGDDYPVGIAGEQLDMVGEYWGTGRLRPLFFPSLSKDIVDDETFRSMERAMATRESMRQYAAFLKTIDVRDLLPKLSVPTLVVHFTGDLAIPPRMGRAMAEAIPDARFLEVGGSDHADISRSPEAIAAIREFCHRLR